MLCSTFCLTIASNRFGRSRRSHRVNISATFACLEENRMRDELEQPRVTNIQPLDGQYLFPRSIRGVATSFNLRVEADVELGLRPRIGFCYEGNFCWNDLKSGFFMNFADDRAVKGFLEVRKASGKVELLDPALRLAYD